MVVNDSISSVALALFCFLLFYSVILRRIYHFPQSQATALVNSTKSNLNSHHLAKIFDRYKLLFKKFSLQRVNGRVGSPLKTILLSHLQSQRKTASI